MARMERKLVCLALAAATGAALGVGAAFADETPPVAAAPSDALALTRGVLIRGETLAGSLRRHGVEPAVINLISTELSQLFDFRRAQPGHTYQLAVDARGELVDFRYRTSQLESLHLFRGFDGYEARSEEAELVARVARIGGPIASSLYRAVQDLGESPQLAVDFTDIFAWDVDFSRSVRPGDEFRILYERLYYVDEGDGSEVFVRPGRILAARYDGAAGSFTAFYFEPEQGRGGYYRPDGTSVERSFLVAPLRYSRISSSYSAARRHPILKVTRPHHGIDYAAPAGTPVWAVADGEVIYKGRAGGFGNLVKVRHANGYVSYYAHLSRFGKGLRVGQKVQQKQVVGHVGQTGLATGPHVCFRVARDGRYVDPASIHSSAGPPVPAVSRHLFEGNRDILLAELEASPLFAVDEAL